MSIKYGDSHKLKDIGAGGEINLNFKIEVEPGQFYYPIMLAAAIGEAECLRVLLTNTAISIDMVDEKTGTNAFWMAAYYGRGDCLIQLATLGINIFNTHNLTKSNALHVSIERGHYECALLLINSRYPLEEPKEGGLTALMLASRDLDAFPVAEQLIKKGADINKISELGQTALS